MKFLQPLQETMSREQLRDVQGERLRAVVARVYRDVPFYKRKLDEAGVHPSDIRTIDDIVKLPFTTKEDFRDNYPFGLYAKPLSEIVRSHASSGTTGKPTVVGYTKADINLWADCCARTLVCGGADRTSVVQVAYGYGLFTGGLGMHYGVERLGAMAIPMSGGNSKRQLMIMRDFGTTHICCTPSYALLLAEVAEEEGFDLRSLGLKAGYFGAEPWSTSMRKAIEERLGITAIDIYGLSEVIGPGVSSECLAHRGLHVFEDHFFPEIIDPVSGKPCPDGEKGELVFTHLTKEGLPLLRYRTRDITEIDHGPCDCGRTFARMQRVSGRTDDMLIIRGVNVFPSQIEHVLLEIEGAEPHYQIIVDRRGTLDDLEIQVEVSPTMFSDEVKKMEGLRKRIAHDIHSTLNVTAKITLVESKSIPRSEGKAKRVIDKRDMN
ncbi:MAG: phenylacetate-CoA ligase [Candidatus Sumerlaeota bacterium]|nr:phenylacetate-CoA ligase [Candidatus Sumerlaeota bacterium]